MSDGKKAWRVAALMKTRADETLRSKAVEASLGLKCEAGGG